MTFTGTATDALSTITPAPLLALIFFLAVALAGPVAAELMDRRLGGTVKEIHPAQALAIEEASCWADRVAEREYTQDDEERRTWELMGR